MHGWVDANLRRWKDPVGREASLLTIELDRLACPECMEFGRKEVLSRAAGGPFWHCAHWHVFDCEGEPVEA